MIFETHSIPRSLAQYVESIFHFKNFVPDHSIERVVPTGHIFIIFELDGITRNTFDNKTLEPIGTFTQVWVSGMHKRHITISAHRDSEMFVIQFKPLGAHPFFHSDVAELNERVVPGEKVFGSEVHELRASLLKSVDSIEKFKLAEEWLLKKFDASMTPPGELYSVIEKLVQSPCSSYHEAIADYANTQKHLIDQCKKYLGLTPKYFQRILRFQEIFQEIQKNKKVSWPNIAYQCGFSDQSHFIKEFKHFSGFNPKEFINEDFDLSEGNFFPLDREG